MLRHVPKDSRTQVSHRFLGLLVLQTVSQPKPVVGMISEQEHQAVAVFVRSKAEAKLSRQR
jgi:hypothetical protein